ncbi:MAG: DUF3502 domain-containing protein, partial [Ruthenibacterium lactatiformans]
EDVPPVLNSFLANGMSIFSKSKHPERALMALDYLRNDPEINGLFCYGIEGKHWQASGDGALVSLADSSNYPYDGNCNWGVRNDATWRVVEGGIPNLTEMNKAWQASARSGRYQTFVFNDTNVKNEIAAMGEIFNTDYKLLGLGFTDDPAADIAKLKEKMAAAGGKRCMRRCKNRRRLLIRPTAADEKYRRARGRGKGSAPLPLLERSAASPKR